MNKKNKNIQIGERDRMYFGRNMTSSIDEEKKSVRVLVSSETLNRRKLVVLNSAFIFGRFYKHPVLLDSHGRYSLDSIIGKWSKLAITEQGVEGTATYFVKDDDMYNRKAETAWNLVKRGLGAFSIGFNVRDGIIGPSAVQESEKLDDRIKKMKPWAVFTKVDLEEISQCVVPVNAEAVQRFMHDHSDENERDEIRALVELAMEEGIYGEADPFKLEEAPEPLVPQEADLTELARIRLLMSCNNLDEIYKEAKFPEK